MLKYIYFGIAGLAGGVLGGMGMGGGTLLIPLLTILLDVPQKTAQALNLLSFIPMAIIALILHAKNKLIDMRKVIVLTLFAVGASVAGSLLIEYVKGEIQTKLFGGFLTLLAIVKFCISVKNHKKNNESGNNS